MGEPRKGGEIPRLCYLSNLEIAKNSKIVWNTYTLMIM